MLINSLVCWFCKADCLLVSPPRSCFRTVKQINHFEVLSEWWPRFPSLFSSSWLVHFCQLSTLWRCPLGTWLGRKADWSSISACGVLNRTTLFTTLFTVLADTPSHKRSYYRRAVTFWHWKCCCALCLNLDFLAWTSCCRSSHVLMTFMAVLPWHNCRGWLGVNTQLSI